MHFLASLPGCQLPWVPSTHQGGDVIMAMWDNFIWNTSLPSSPVAVKSPFICPILPAVLSAPYWGQGLRVGRLRGETEDWQRRYRRWKGRGHTAVDPAVYHLSFFPPSKYLQSKGPRVRQVVGGLRGEVKVVITQYLQVMVLNCHLSEV